MQSTTNGGKALDRAFSFLLWGNQEEERKSVHFCSINAKGMLIFIVADIWNCYNMDMKKATNLNLSSWIVRDNFEFVKMWCT